MKPEINGLFDSNLVVNTLSTSWIRIGVIAIAWNQAMFHLVGPSTPLSYLRPKSLFLKKKMELEDYENSFITPSEAEKG